MGAADTGEVLIGKTTQLTQTSGVDRWQLYPPQDVINTVKPQETVTLFFEWHKSTDPNFAKYQQLNQFWQTINTLITTQGGLSELNLETPDLYTVKIKV